MCLYLSKPGFPDHSGVYGVTKTPTYKKVTFAEDLGQGSDQGKAEAAAALVSMQNRVRQASLPLSMSAKKHSMSLMMGHQKKMKMKKMKRIEMKRTN
jgi:hypothetical protein